MTVHRIPNPGVAPMTVLPMSIRDHLHEIDAPIIAVLDLDDAGSRVMVADLLARRVLAVDPADPATSANALDRAIADHLVADGRVERPVGEEWQAELLGVVGRARAALAGSDGTFLMGDNHVRLVRVSRRDVDVATAPLADHVSDRIEQTLDTLGVTDAVIVLAPTHIRWPGAVGRLSATTHRRMLVMDGQTVRAVEAPGAVPMPAAHARDAVVEDAITEEIPAITDPAAPTVYAYDEAVESPDVVGPPVGADALVDVDASVDAEPEYEQHHERSRNSSGQRWLLGGAVAAVLAVLGTATVVAFTGTTDPGPTPPAVIAAAPTGPTTSASTEYADPADLVAAQETAVRYTTPPPPKTTKKSTTRSQRRAPSSPNGGQPRITIPVPGFPPIVIP
ncbi:hypothetical protein [Gordonia sp. NB41Y]|uniref:hypothetical protein n=1 Tax=Gordonia sp. NB41Y TaxID=875808 RepID=UPI00273AE932|nr:hypothetical protein [Gordonia sp. NB41Y]WLP89128.1 hypothetical protein Q9K23_16150 [Gordonia sp. NB41Y]